MEMRAQKIYAKADHNISIDVIPGHFATNHSHINYYVNMTDLKTRHKMARAGALVLSAKYALVPVDTILCLEGTQVVGAFLAEALSQDRMAVASGTDINVLTPESNANNQMIFRENTLPMVSGKNILLLLSTATTGKTIRRSVDCLAYYDGNLAGIAAMFSAAPTIAEKPVQSIFTVDDIPDYQTYAPGQCEMCQTHQKMDAIVNSFGYSTI